jgi:hypothetical protein
MITLLLADGIITVPDLPFQNWKDLSLTSWHMVLFVVVPIVLI